MVRIEPRTAAGQEFGQVNAPITVTEGGTGAIASVEVDPATTFVKPYGQAARPLPAAPQESITWAPIGEAKLIPFSGSSYQTVRKALVSTFGPFPIRLSRLDHLDIIFAMRNAAGDGGSAYKAIFDALSTLPGIELTEF